ncbi:MAG: hypothetical protein AAFQ98_15085, partial [Bacteroidota bacterium]
MSTVTLSYNNLVMGINDPNNASADSFTLDFNEAIGSAKYKPTKTQNPKTPAGEEYDCFTITNASGAQAFLQWSQNSRPI